MNQNQFKQYIESTRDCSSALLDSAVSDGLCRAKKTGLDMKKLRELVAMCAVTAAFCITMNSESLKIEATNYLMRNSIVTQNGSENLYVYLKSITSTLKIYLGGY